MPNRCLLHECDFDFVCARCLIMIGGLGDAESDAMLDDVDAARNALDSLFHNRQFCNLAMEFAPLEFAISVMRWVNGRSRLQAAQCCSAMINFIYDSAEREAAASEGLKS